MARLRGHRTLDLGQPLYVRRACTVGARTFAAGDLFPWRELGLSPRKLHQLWMQRRIAHGRADERMGAEDPTALVALPEVTDAALPAPASPPEVTVPAGAAALEQAVPVAETIDVSPSAPASTHGRNRQRR